MGTCRGHDDTTVSPALQSLAFVSSIQTSRDFMMERLVAWSSHTNAVVKRRAATLHLGSPHQWPITTQRSRLDSALVPWTGDRLTVKQKAGVPSH